jgi:AcrR family transcriptional regulator
VQVLLEAAAQVFEREGYDGTTTDAIAERAGVSIGSLYQYFANKDAIVLALCYCHAVEGLQLSAPLVSKLAQDPPPAVAEVIREVVRIAVASHSERPRLHRLLFEEMPLTRELQQTFAHEEAEIGSWLANYLRRAPGAAVANPELAAHLVQQTLFLAVHRFATNPPAGFTEQDCEHEIANMLVAYLTASVE